MEKERLRLLRHCADNRSTCAPAALSPEISDDINSLADFLSTQWTSKFFPRNFTCAPRICAAFSPLKQLKD